MTVKIKHFTNESKNEIENILSTANHNIPDLIIDKILDDAVDQNLIVVGLGDNAVPPTVKILDKLITAHNSGIPILFTHGFPTDISGIRTLSVEDQSLLNEFIGKFNNDTLRSIISDFFDTTEKQYWNKLEKLGFTDSNDKDYDWFS